VRERGRNIERERERERERKRERPLKGPSGTRTLIIFAISEKGKTDHFALDSAEWHANFHHFEVVAISKKRKKRQTILPLTATSGMQTFIILKWLRYQKKKKKTDHFALDSDEWHTNFEHFEVHAISDVVLDRVSFRRRYTSVCGG